MLDTRSDLDCLIVGAGPAGLTAGLYLARYGRRFAIVDEGDPRAAWIPVSRNIPLFVDGISGRQLLDRAREHLALHGVRPKRGRVAGLALDGGLFKAALAEAAAGPAPLRSRFVLLATGAEDVEPELPDLPQAVRRGLIRYCPICDGYEVRGKRLAVVGFGAQGLGEAAFLAETYTPDVTLLTLGGGARQGSDERLVLSPEDQARAEMLGIRVVESKVARIDLEGDRIAAVHAVDGETLRFDAIYTALGLVRRSGLARALGAAHDEDGALVVDDHGRTNIPGLYAAGGVVRGLDQVVTAMGQAAVAATDIHNRLRQAKVS